MGGTEGSLRPLCAGTLRRSHCLRWSRGFLESRDWKVSQQLRGHLLRSMARLTTTSGHVGMPAAKHEANELLMRSEPSAGLASLAAIREDVCDLHFWAQLPDSVFVFASKKK